MSEKFADAPCEYVVDRFVRHVSEGGNVRYVVHWYDYTPAENTVEPPETIPEHFITRYWRQRRKNDAARQRCGRAQAHRRGNVRK